MASTEETAKRSGSGSKLPAAAMEASTCSSRITEPENKEEEHGGPGPEESSLTPAKASALASGGLAVAYTGASWSDAGDSSLTNSEVASAFVSSSSPCWSDGAGSECQNDDVEAMEKEHLFDKVLTPSDVGKLNRLVIPKKHAEMYFPLDASANEQGLLLGFEDSAGKVWRFRYSYWNSSQSYVVTKGWSRFVREKRLVAGDTVSFSRGAGEAARGRLFIDWKRQVPGFLMPPPPRTHITGHLSLRPAVTGGLPLDLDSAPLVKCPAAAGKRMCLFGVNLDDQQRNRKLQHTGGNIDSDTGSLLSTAGRHRDYAQDNTVQSSRIHYRRRRPWEFFNCCFYVVHFVGILRARVRIRQERMLHGTYESANTEELSQGSDKGSLLLTAGMHTDYAQDSINEILTSQYDNTVQSSRIHYREPWEIFKCCFYVVQFVGIIRARVRIRQARKLHGTCESANTEELGVTVDRLINKGTGWTSFSNPKAWAKALESDSSEVTKVVKRQMLDENVRRSTFTEEDTFYPRHKYLCSKERVEKPHFTFHKDVKAWIAIKKQYEGGFHHSCRQQVACKPIARNDIKEMLIEKILLDIYDGSNHTVVCINGECGHGKTSLLHVLYNDQELMDAFDRRIWIQMSDKLDILMLYRKIIEFFMGDHCSITDIRFLQEMVMDEIADKKILLFLDDADIGDQRFWNTILEDLNASAKGSAVIMATRRFDVSTFRDVATYSYFLNPLSEENKLMLLQQYTVVGTDIQSNPDLLMVSKRIISRIGGNPLTLKAIGGFLWHADSSLEMDKFEGSVIPLQLCHDVLPVHLQKCLAFCSLFPEGYIFDKHHMVRLWISHGCVTPAEGFELEDVGVEYFNELLCRSFFQYSPVQNDKDDKFVMHELMYKVVESVSRDKYFKSEAPMSSVPENIIHVSLVSSRFQTVELIQKTEELNYLQTFMVVVRPEWQPYKISFPVLKLFGLDDFFLKFTSIETLDLSHTDTEELPGSIVGLGNLKYLSVNNTSIRSLPSELCSLNNLQTLEAKDCRFLTELPGDTKNLLKLRHLDLTKERGYVQLPQGVGQLTKLQTLPVFHASSDPSHCSVSELGNLHNLRGCLLLSGLESVKTGSKAKEANLKDKHHLKDLTLQWHDGGINIDDEDEDEDAENVAEQVLENLQPHTNIQELAIRGYEGSVFPAWMQGSSSVPNLVSLTVDSCCNCTQFPAVFAQLPSLKFLGVRKMYLVNRLISSNIHGSIMFPSLELLNLWEMYGLEELFEASEGDCPRLRKVWISRCPDLKRLPCTPVRELVLHCGHQFPDIPELASLVSLKIEGFHGVKSFALPAAAALPVLKKLEIRSCKELSSVDGLSALTSVQRLKIAGCPKLVLPRTDSLST